MDSSLPLPRNLQLRGLSSSKMHPLYDRVIVASMAGRQEEGNGELGRGKGRGTREREKERGRSPCFHCHSPSLPFPSPAMQTTYSWTLICISKTFTQTTRH